MHADPPNKPAFTFGCIKKLKQQGKTYFLNCLLQIMNYSISDVEKYKLHETYTCYLLLDAMEINLVL